MFPRGRKSDRDLMDLQLERSFLCLLLLPPRAGSQANLAMSSKVVQGDFGSGQHALIFRAILQLVADGKDVHTESVRSYLDDCDQLGAVGGSQYLMDLTDSVPVSVDVERLRRLGAKRRLQESMRYALGMIGTEREDDALGTLEVAQVALREVVREVGDDTGPCLTQPLRGLRRLAEIAVVGADRLEALAVAHVDFAWADVAVCGTIVLLAGGPSEGKTTLLFLILAARANTSHIPVRLLDRPVQPAPHGQYLLLIEGEHSEASTARKLVQSIALMGVDRSAIGRVIIIARKSVTVGSPEWEEVTQLVAAGLISDIAIDTIARCSPADANDEQAQVAVFAALTRTIDAAPEGTVKPTVWLCAHVKKNGTGALADVSGSAQRVGQSDSVLLVKGTKRGGRTVSSRVTFEKLRETPEIYPAPVDFALVRDVVDGVMSLQTSVADFAPDDTPAAPQHFGQPLTQQVVALLQREGPMSRRSLRMRVRVGDDRLAQAIDTLERDRLIEHQWVTVQGRRRLLIRLPGEALHAAE